VSDTLDISMMRRAIALARPRLGHTWPNPAVGCVIARGEEILAEAVTADGGRPHAEEQALAALGGQAAGATCYVTLEPCGERSAAKTSCSERLAEAGVVRVVIACDNPEPLSAGRGVRRLREAGVLVQTGFLGEEAEPLYRGFRRKLSTGLPLVETASSGEGFDARFELFSGEDAAQALGRYGEAGYTRLWTAPDDPATEALKARGLLG
jgi:diaminohydroxyphosphoribosylaminopyrimidine deaminase/5-amino-6-(5-phosphoribosylamino)uracil reductase